MAHWTVINPIILNLHTPYHCERRTYGYRFETDFGYIYDLTFIKYPTFCERPEYVLYMFKRNNPYKNIILSDYFELVKLNFYS